MAKNQEIAALDPGLTMKKAVPRNIPILVFICIALASCTHTSGKHPPKAIKGVLDLRDWDFEKDGIVRLNGEWDFYFNALINPDQIYAAQADENKPYAIVPHKWRYLSLNGKKLRGDGFATYHLKILCNKPDQKIGLNIVLWDCAYKMYAHNELVDSQGVVGDTRASSASLKRYKAVSFSLKGNEFDLVLQYSEFEHFYGGLWPFLEIGTALQIEDTRLQTFGLEMFFIGFIFLMALYHLALFFIGRKEKEYLYFSLFVLIGVVFLGTYNENVLIRFFPNMPFKIYTPLYVFSSVLALPVGFLFFSKVFPREFPRVLTRGYLFISSIFCVTCLFFPKLLTREGMDLYSTNANLSAIALSLNLIISLTIAAFRRRSGAVLSLTGGVILSTAIIYDCLGNLLEARITPFYSLGFLSFLLCQLIAMAQRFAKMQQEMLSHRDQLYHAEKLASLGAVVAGVAHEINNPNNSLLLDAQLNEKAWNAVLPILDEHVLNKGEFDIGGYRYGEFKEDFSGLPDRMKRNSERIKRITEDLRSFAKKDISFNEDIDINNVIRSVLSVVEHVTKRSTKNLHVSFGTDVPLIKGNTRYLEQVVINLVKNACQALPSTEKGIFISTSHDSKSNCVAITVRDEGIGMDDIAQKNIFTPFYTTKGVEGTGLGLSICSNIVKSHGGRIEIDSKHALGTTIRVILPAIPPR